MQAGRNKKSRIQAGWNNKKHRIRILNHPYAMFYIFFSVGLKSIFQLLFKECFHVFPVVVRCHVGADWD